MKRTGHHPISVLLLLGLLAFGCSAPRDSTGVGNPGISKTDEALIEDGNDSVDTGDLGSTITTIPFLSLVRPEEANTADEAASRSVLSATAPLLRDKLYLPPACVTASSAANVATFVFDKCTSVPLGLINLSGTLTAKFSVASLGHIQADITTTELTLSAWSRKARALIPITATLGGAATLTLEGSTRTSSWNGGYVGKAPSGRTITHNALATWSYDTTTRCIDIPLEASTTTLDPPTPPRTSSGLTITLSDYHRCGDRRTCPQRGTLVITDKASNLSIAIHFLGGRKASATLPGGGTAAFDLTCDP